MSCGRDLALGFIVVGAMMASAITAVLLTRNAESSMPEPHVPADAKRAALASFREYGRVDRVLEETPATLHNPHGDELWALLVEGRFEVTGPLVLGDGDPTTTRAVATAGAVIVSDTGELVRIGIWGPDAKGNPVWERIFEDAYPIESD